MDFTFKTNGKDWINPKTGAKFANSEFQKKMINIF